MPMLVVNSDPERLWGKPLEPTREELSKMYFTIEAIEDGEISFTMYGTGLFCSTDNGETWNKATSPFSVSAGDKVLCKSTSLTTGITNKFDSTGKWNVYGNILSLKYGDDFEDKDTELNIEALFWKCTTLVSAKNLILPNSSCKYSSLFYGYSLFFGCTSLEEAPELPATTLSSGCYAWMFSGCSSLKKAPELPATTLATNCYKQMFQDCTSLTTGPELPATTLEEGCYSNMFYGCTSLTTSPELPATTLAQSCYDSMFRDCTSLTTAPELPATTLNNYCYSNMFSGCTSLTIAPELPATTLNDYCYDYMFRSCTNLTYIKILATDNISTDTLSMWLYNASTTGTFVKVAGVEYPAGISGIPSGWTVEEV